MYKYIPQFSVYVIVLLEYFDHCIIYESRKRLGHTSHSFSHSFNQLLIAECYDWLNTLYIDCIVFLVSAKS